MPRLTSLSLLAFASLAACRMMQSDPSPVGGKGDNLGSPDGGGYAADAGACVATLIPSDDRATHDYDHLLALATTLDFPFAKVAAYDLDGCDDVALIQGQAAIANAIVQASFPDASADTLAALEEHPFEAGAARYLQLMTESKQAIVDRTAGGSWDPTTHPEGALFGQLDALFASLTATATATPLRFREIPIHLEAAECSEELAGLVDTQTGHLIVVHILPKC